MGYDRLGSPVAPFLIRVLLGSILGFPLRVQGLGSTQRLQYPLIKQYTLNHMNSLRDIGVSGYLKVHLPHRGLRLT